MLIKCTLIFFYIFRLPRSVNLGFIVALVNLLKLLKTVEVFPLKVFNSMVEDNSVVNLLPLYSFVVVNGIVDSVMRCFFYLTKPKTIIFKLSQYQLVFHRSAIVNLN